MSYVELIEKAYTAFNARDTAAVLTLMHPDVQWPNGWEGGYVQGQAAVQDYWARQWAQINPQVTPESIQETDNGRIEVTVHQLVKDLQGQVIADGKVKHVYTIINGLIEHMEIRQS